ncbi:hypothetical protein AAVH_15006, partial [Aphelenchoides avenae]
MRFTEVDAIKEPKCVYGFTEVKYEDLLLGGIKYAQPPFAIISQQIALRVCS